MVSVRKTQAPLRRRQYGRVVCAWATRGRSWGPQATWALQRIPPAAGLLPARTARSTGSLPPEAVGLQPTVLLPSNSHSKNSQRSQIRGGKDQESGRGPAPPPERPPGAPRRPESKTATSRTAAQGGCVEPQTRVPSPGCIIFQHSPQSGQRDRARTNSLCLAL